MTDTRQRIEAVLSKKYDIQESIAAGGMGEIYLGIHRALDKRVAIKIIHQQLSKDETFRKRFYREARLAATLDHRGIIDIYDFGSTDDFDYIIMPYIEGETLQQILKRRRRLKLNEAVEMMIAITDALAYAHERDVIHRDIKPSNIMCDRQHYVYLTDFGISKDLGDATLTIPDTVLGSPKYMSPEQTTGAAVDARSDLYSLGLIFYEMLAGTHPFADRDTSGLYYAQAHDVPQRPDTIRPDIPPAAADIIMRLLAKPPDARFASGRDLIRALKSLRAKAAGAGLNGSGKTQAQDAALIAGASLPGGDTAFDDATVLEDATTMDDTAFVEDAARLDDATNVDNTAVMDDATVMNAAGPAADETVVAPVSGRRKWPWLLPAIIVAVLVLIAVVLLRPGGQKQQLPVSDIKAAPSPQAPSPEPTMVEDAGHSQPATSVAGSEPNVALIRQLNTIAGDSEAPFVRLWTQKQAFRIGDPISYFIKTSKNCYLTVFLFTADEQVIQIFPNRYDQNAFVTANTTHRIPGKNTGVELEVTGPPGYEEILALATEKPLDLLAATFDAQPFYIIDPNDPGLLQRIADSAQLARKHNIAHQRVRYAITR